MLPKLALPVAPNVETRSQIGQERIRTLAGQLATNDQLSHRLPPLLAKGGDPHLAFYPRLDAQVTCKLKHLLKPPFSVHPAIGRVTCR